MRQVSPTLSQSNIKQIQIMDMEKFRFILNFIFSDFFYSLFFFFFVRIELFCTVEIN